MARTAFGAGFASPSARASPCPIASRTFRAIIGSMKKFPNGCFLPLNAIAVHPQGFPHFCLTSTLKRGAALSEFAEARREIHQQLLKGEWPATCTRCLNKEKR